MTLDEAKEQLNDLIDIYEMLLDGHVDVDDLKAIKMAIASLKAWDKVKQEINNLFSKPPCYTPNYEDYNMFLKIIDKHLQEVENDN